MPCEKAWEALKPLPLLFINSVLPATEFRLNPGSVLSCIVFLESAFFHCAVAASGGTTEKRFGRGASGPPLQLKRNHGCVAGVYLFYVNSISSLKLQKE